MRFLTYEYQQTCGVDSQQLTAISSDLAPCIEELAAAVSGSGHEQYAFAHMPQDQEHRAACKKMIAAKKALNPKALVVIGIGGSNLGTLAVHELLHGTLYNESNPPIRIYCADTVDSDYIHAIYLRLEQELEKGNTILLNIISKSGSTTETIANAEVFLALLRKYHPADFHEYVVVTTDQGSALWLLAEKERFALLAIPKKLGGRYSVLSCVGLFPLGMIGVDIEKLCEGAISMNALCVQQQDNPAVIGAAINYALYQKNIPIHDTFIFSVDGQSLGKWYRQLMGESLGKELSKDGKRNPVGIVPTVSLGSTDLHSVGQLYLGGPVRHFTTFITIEQLNSDLQVPVFENFEALVADIQGKPLRTIMHAIEIGIKAAYKKNERPFVSLVFPAKSAYYVGQFLQLKMFEIVYLGYLLGVDPFDQPNVELYKQETRKILSQ
jgi:glucose-6-phosphate isomerase